MTSETPRENGAQALLPVRKVAQTGVVCAPWPWARSEWRPLILVALVVLGGIAATSVLGEAAAGSLIADSCFSEPLGVAGERGPSAGWSAAAAAEGTWNASA